MKHKYITKFDYENAQGYQARVPAVENGVIIPYDKQTNNQFFKKGTNSWKAALTEAIAWRDECLERNNSMYLLESKRRERLPYINSQRNRSGVIGIAQTHTVKENETYYSYTANYSIDKKQKRKCFSCRLHGDKAAFQYACLERYKHSGKLILTDKSMEVWIPEGVEYSYEPTYR